MGQRGLPNWINRIGRRSLAGRMMIGLALSVALIWAGLIIWAVWSALAGGREEAARDMDSYSRQVLSVANVMAKDRNNLARALAAVESIEREPDSDGDEPDLFFIEAWIGGDSIYSASPLPTSKPLKTGFLEISVADTDWWTFAQHDPSSDITIRLSTDAGGRAAILWPDIITFFLPLVVSLPLLLIPAWFMTRFGLTPLGTTAMRISERVNNADLTALPLTNYRELDPVVQATNQLMERLNLQLHRERGFVADVAHEMKTPLAIVQTNLGILESSRDPQRRSDALRDLKSGIARSNHLIQQLLKMARLDPEFDRDAQKRHLDLAEFIRERVAQAAPLARRRNVQLEVAAPDSCELAIDADAIAAIVDNLLDNAIKYSPLDGRVVVELEHSGETPAFVLSVKDEGPGIPASERDAAFDRFRRLSSDADDIANQDGAGLGLSIVARATARIGGSIKLLPAPGQRGLIARLSVTAG